MGATTYTIIGKGTNVREVFNSLVDDSICYHGIDPYNGQISTTTLGREVKLPEDILQAKDRNNKIYDYVDDNDRRMYPTKRKSNYANLGVHHYRAFTPEWEDDEEVVKRQNGVRTIDRFSVVAKKDANRKTRTSQANDSFLTLRDAKREAKEMALKYGESMTIKKHRTNGDMFTLGHMNLVSDGKEYKTARKAKNKLYKPIYEFMFFVFASM